MAAQGAAQRRGPAEGIEEIVAAIAEHRQHLRDSGELRERRERRAAAEIEAIALGTLRARMEALRGGTVLGELARKVADGDLDPHTAAAELVTMTEALIGKCLPQD